jgi:hypothetical protein
VLGSGSLHRQLPTIVWSLMTLSALFSMEVWPAH